jgi:predicted alpha/beta hydrolase family esterase
MTVNVLFIQGAGEGAYAEDALLADSLKTALGAGFDVQFPEMIDEDDAQLDVWSRQIDEALASVDGDVIAVGHSVGASILAKHLSDTELDPRIVGVFLLATPFWSGDGIWVWEEGKLERSAAERLSQRVPVFLYHCEDDEVVPFSHLRPNADFLRGATVKVLQTGGHQFGNDLALVARDIRSLVEDATTSDPEPREPVH